MTGGPERAADPDTGETAGTEDLAVGDGGASSSEGVGQVQRESVSGSASAVALAVVA